MRTENPRAQPLLEQLLATAARAQDTHAAAEAAAFLLVASARTVGQRIGYDPAELAHSLLAHAFERIDAPDLRVVGDSGGDSAVSSGEPPVNPGDESRERVCRCGDELTADERERCGRCDIVDSLEEWLRDRVNPGDTPG